MMGYAYIAEAVMPDGGEHDSASAGIEVCSLSKGAFLLRRPHYFNNIWHEKIISHNLRVALVDNIAMHYVNRGVALPDLIKEGNQGLTHALENFEVEGGSRFSSYAARCIRQHIEHAITSRCETSRLSAVFEIMPAPVIADAYTHRQRVSSWGAKPHHQCI
jgi:hypothetical protein